MTSRRPLNKKADTLFAKLYFTGDKMKKIIMIFLFLSAIASPSYAINIFEKIAYQKDVIKTYKAPILINPLTKDIKYIWCRTAKNGYWMPVTGRMKEQYQAIYDRERAAR